MKAKRFLTTGGVAVAGIAAALAIYSSPAEATGNDKPAPAPTAGTELSTLPETLNDWTVQTLDVPDHAGAPFGTKVVLDGKEELLLLHPHSIRAKNFRLLEDDGSGILKEIQAPAPATYRGEVAGQPDSLIAGSLINGQLKATVWIDGVQFGIEPLSDYESVAPTQFHVVYKASDLIDHGHKCGVDDHAHGGSGAQQGHQGHNHGPAPKKPSNPGPSQGGPDGPDALETYEVAYDTDWEYYVDMGQSSTNVMNTVEDVQNGVSAIYERDVELCSEITTILVRTSSNDPYSSTSSASGLLNEFRSHWNSQQGGITRDLASMWTGRANSSTIGIAWLSVVCNRSQAYNVNWNFTSNRTSRINLVAHEQGHNWSAGHCCGSCSGCSTCRIMCPCINGCGGGGQFGSSSQNAITNHKNSRNCLDNGCGGGPGGLTLAAPTPGTAGLFNTFTCTGGTSGQTMTFWWGKATGSSSVPGCIATLGIDNAKVGGTSGVGGTGTGVLTAFVPSKAAGVLIQLQVSQSGTCEVSNVVAERF